MTTNPAPRIMIPDSRHRIQVSRYGWGLDFFRYAALCMYVIGKNMVISIKVLTLRRGVCLMHAFRAH